MIISVSGRSTLHGPPLPVSSSLPKSIGQYPVYVMHNIILLSKRLYAAHPHTVAIYIYIYYNRIVRAVLTSFRPTSHHNALHNMYFVFFLSSYGMY